MGTNTRLDVSESEEDILDGNVFLRKKLLWWVTVNAVVLWRIEQMAVILKICILEKETRTKLDIVSRQFNESDPNLHLKPQQATRTALLSLVGMLYRVCCMGTLSLEG